MKTFKEIPQSSIPKIRDFLLEKQHQKCAICEVTISSQTGVALDHQHCTKSEGLGENGAGLIRGVLCRNCNSLEGKFWNASKRYRINGVEDSPVSSRVQWLRNLANYLENNASNNVEILGEFVLHPKETRIPKISKTEYNQIKEAFEEDQSNYKKDGSLKPFPKFTGKWSKKLEDLWLHYFNKN